MSKKAPDFPVGPVGKRDLRRALVRSTDPTATIRDYQQAHSLHTMIAKALGTNPVYSGEKETETLDSDPAMSFLSHLGVSQYEVHKRISDSLLKQLEDRVKHAKVSETTELLKKAWPYATAIPELRPVVWAIFKQLGENTPRPALLVLAEQDDGDLKHKEIFQQLPSQIKRLVWEADWEDKIKYNDSDKPKDFLEKVKTTLLSKTCIDPLFEEYYKNAQLSSAANKPFVSSKQERRVITSQRRALKANSDTSTGKIVSQIRNVLCDSTSTGSSVYRPKLLHAVLSTLMARHATQEVEFLGGSDHLHCTLVADLLLSTGGPLPKAYTYVLTLARNIDDCVQEGNIPDGALSKIQGCLRQIFEADEEEKVEEEKKEPAGVGHSIIRQLNRIITAGLNAMKENDPQSLFLNPVTDAIAPGYSKIISKPMCISRMEHKVSKDQYNDLAAWEADVRLMFKNCIDYNQGAAGQWFRGEAQRQGKVFRDEIYSQAKRLYQTEIAKRTFSGEAIGAKRKEPSGPSITPLPAALKKRKKDSSDESAPSMPAVASMLLADPFFVRIVIARVLQELRRSIAAGNCLPLSHRIIPSLLQLLHMARWSSQICTIRGKKYFIPDPGMQNEVKPDDPGTAVPRATLRRYLPLLVRLLVEADLDRRVILGGDLHDAAQTDMDLQPLALSKEWDSDGMVLVARSILEGSLVHLCLPGNTEEISLSITFPKFALAVKKLAYGSDLNDGFLYCLIASIKRHKTRLMKSARDIIFTSWLEWATEVKGGGMRTKIHEYLVVLLNEWSALGNQVLPRDDLYTFASQLAKAINDSSSDEVGKLSDVWDKDEFSKIRTQYDRMLRFLPETKRKEWMETFNVGTSAEAMETE